MRLFLLCGLLIHTGGMASAQSDLFEKAPTAVDEALRDRVTKYYSAHISGKFRDAFEVVAPDAQDDFLAASHDHYSKCDLTKITYLENFTKATALVACKGELTFQGRRMEATVPRQSSWKLIDGQWYWYVIHTNEKITPFGIFKAGPEDSSPHKNGGLPGDPAVLAKQILTQLALDRSDLQISLATAGAEEVHLTNKLQGAIHVTVDPPGFPGLRVTVSKPQLAAGEGTAIVLSYNPNDSEIQCYDCAQRRDTAINVNVRIAPTNQVLPIHVKFLVPPQAHHEIALPTKKQ